jgi:hypothetical protein
MVSYFSKLKKLEECLFGSIPVLEKNYGSDTHGL